MPIYLVLAGTPSPPRPLPTDTLQAPDPSAAAIQSCSSVGIVAHVSGVTDAAPDAWTVDVDVSRIDGHPADERFVVRVERV